MKPDRFWSKVRKGKRCWEWTGSLRHGYGSFYLHDRMCRAHRFSWELHFGPIPTGLHVLHRCDNRRCVRPEHLFVGTNQENMQDMVRKGRCYNQKLFPADIAYIAASPAPTRMLAERFGVSKRLVQYCRRNARASEEPHDADPD